MYVLNVFQEFQISRCQIHILEASENRAKKGEKFKIPKNKTALF